MRFDVQKVYGSILLQWSPGARQSAGVLQWVKSLQGVGGLERGGGRQSDPPLVPQQQD